MTVEKILSIEEFTDEKKKVEEGWNVSFDGYKVVTNLQTIRVGISNGQSCCEDWGYMISEEEFSQYVGATLHKVSYVDTSLNVEELEGMYVDVDSCMFINLDTSAGTFQLTVYNEHNGYYGHQVFVESNQITEESCL